jgi:hypothetical protein
LTYFSVLLLAYIPGASVILDKPHRKLSYFH